MALTRETARSEYPTETHSPRADRRLETILARGRGGSLAAGRFRLAAHARNARLADLDENAPEAVQVANTVFC